MVALKLAYNGVHHCCQEAKQERRGGIETDLLGFVSIKLEEEAGTPWWH